METRTEEAAKRLICPLLTTHGALMKCQGCACMAWTWDNDGFEYNHRLKTDQNGKLVQGYAGADIGQYIGAGWEIVEHASAYHLGVQKREVLRRPLPRGRTGSCGALTAKVADVEISS